jgi:tungstate transport system permease protein
VFEIAARSVGVSLAATLIAACFAFAGALWIVYGTSRWRIAMLGAFNLGLGLPPVAVGLAVAFALWRSGPLGSLDLLYTPAAMVAAQTIVIIPLIGSLAVLALRAGDPSLNVQLRALGVPAANRFELLARETSPGLLAAALAGFGRAIAEVGAAQMTGGNIEGQTRVLTTATMLDVGRGEFGAAFADVAVLLGIVAVVAGTALVLQTRWR